MPGGIDERGKKLFIGGLHMKTTTEALKEFFSQWGEIIDCVVMKDPATGKSRGFGFVTYSDTEAVDLAQNNRPHLIDGIKVDSKRAMPKENTTAEYHASVNRLFVGRLNEETTSEDLYEYFGQYGSVTDAFLIKNSKGDSRGFGFVTFEDNDSVDKIILEKPHNLNGSNLEVKKALPKDDKRLTKESSPRRSMTNPRPRRSLDRPSRPHRGGDRDREPSLPRYSSRDDFYNAPPRDYQNDYRVQPNSFRDPSMHLMGGVSNNSYYNGSNNMDPYPMNRNSISGGTGNSHYNDYPRSMGDYRGSSGVQPLSSAFNQPPSYTNYPDEPIPLSSIGSSNLGSMGNSIMSQLGDYPQQYSSMGGGAIRDYNHTSKYANSSRSSYYPY